MSAMRVKQLANELNMDPKELVKKLNEVGIAVKTHASPMSEDDVKLAREKLAKEVVEAGGKVDAATKKKVEAEIKKTKEKEKAEVEARRKAREAELKEREAHKRKTTRAGVSKKSTAKPSDNKEEVKVTAEDIKEAVKKIATTSPDAGLSKLEKQIVEETDRAKREAAAKNCLLKLKRTSKRLIKRPRLKKIFATEMLTKQQKNRLQKSLRKSFLLALRLLINSNRCLNRSNLKRNA